MKIGKLFLCIAASAAVFAGCKNEEENLGTPSIKVNPTSLNFEKEGGADNIQSVALTSTRDWTATVSEGASEWLSVEPASGSASSEAQTISVKVTENTDLDRTATVTFTTSNGTAKATLKVSQAGPGGSIEDTYVYFNDFDKERAVQDENNYWPYADEFDGWKNEKGSGISSVEYDLSGMQVRANGFSDNDYSLYKDNASGANNMFFASSPHFSVKNITLPESSRDFKLSFGVTKYKGNEADNHVSPDEFLVYLSNDGSKWVQITDYTFASGSAPDGAWDLASKVFSVPEATSALYIYFKTDVASGFRIDDLKLATSTEAGTEIDFSQGVEIGGGDPVEPGEEITVKEVLDASEGVNVTTSGIVMAVGATGVILGDGTGNIFVYTKDKPAVEIGNSVKVTGETGSYNNLPQIANSKIDFVENSEPAYPEAVELNSGNVESLKSGFATYVTYTGVITKEGSYYNFTIEEGFSIAGSVYSPAESVGINDKVGIPVEMTGYYVGYYNNYIYVLPVSIEPDSDYKYCNISKDKVSVSSAAGTATFDVSANVGWTVTSDNEDFTVDTASGENNGTVTVSYEENTGAEARTATITVTPASESGLEAKTVTITQAAPATGDEVVDVLTADLFKATSSTYTDFSGVSVTSPAVYAGNSANDSGAIQLRSKNSNSGIVSTTSGGKVRKVTVEWKSNTTAGRTLDIYGSNEAYSSASELYNDVKGEKVASIVYGESTTIDITGDYAYVGLRSNDGAMYLNKIEIVWE